MKKSFCIILLALCSTYGLTQNELSNLEKYWHYRHRLVNYFMVVGEGPGMSLPADIRNSFNGAFGCSCDLRWGEAPVYLGYYLGTLATEYRLLKDNYQNTDQTLTELYYAIKAAIRLDVNAEPMWNQTGVQDGFLIRDDVPPYFVLEHSNELNVNIDPNQSMVGSGIPVEVSQTHSDYYENHFIHSNSDALNAVSQDVIYQLLLGFALVHKYVDQGNLPFNNYVTGTPMNIDLWTMAKEEANYIISYIKENHGHHWEMRAPDGAAVVGGNAIYPSYGLAKAGTVITGVDYSDGHSDGNRPLWQECNDRSFILCDPIAVDGSLYQMAMVLAALSDSWRSSIFETNPENITPDKLLELGDYAAGGFGSCSYFDSHFGIDVFYGAVWDVFHGGADKFICDMCRAKEILNSAPWDGPWYHNANDNALLYGYPGWCASRRFFDVSPVQNAGKSGFEGNYNGLDYMLLFNLYYLDAQKRQIVGENLGTVYIPSSDYSGLYPYTAFNLSSFESYLAGSNSHPAVYDFTGRPYFFNSLTVSSSPPFDVDPGNLSIKYGRSGVVFTNTSVEYGAYMNVYPDECVPPQASWYFDPSMYHRTANPEAISDALLPSDIFLFPNPANRSFTLRWPGTDDPEVSITIFNARGEMILERKPQGVTEFEIDVSDYPAGIYFVQVLCGGKSSSRKLIIER